MILLSYYFHFFCHCASIWFVICQRGLIQNNCKNNMKQYLPVSLGAGSSLFSTPCCWNLSGSDSWLPISSLLALHALKRTVRNKNSKLVKSAPTIDKIKAQLWLSNTVVKNWFCVFRICYDLPVWTRGRGTCSGTAGTAATRPEPSQGSYSR